VIGSILAAAICAFAQQPTPVYPRDESGPQAPWIVTVIHSTDVLKLADRLRSKDNVQVGVTGTPPGKTLNITTGLLIDDKGHVVTRLTTIDPKETDPTLMVSSNHGEKLQARLVGIDCATGFAVLRVESLKAELPIFAPPTALVDGAKVRLWSAAATRKRAGGDQGLDISPTVQVTEGSVNVTSTYSRARGAVGLKSDQLLSRNDSSVVTADQSHVVGMAQFAGFGRAYLYPIEMIREKVAKRVIEKGGSVPSGWLGISTDTLAGSAVSNPHKGVLITEVVPGSPAANGGLKPNDVIVGVDDFQVNSTADLSALLSSSPAGRRMKLKAVRNTEDVALDIELGGRGDCSAPVSLPFEEQVGQSVEQQLRVINKRLTDLQILYNSYSQTPEWRGRSEALAEIRIEMDRLDQQKFEIERQARRFGDNVRTNDSFGVAVPAGFTIFELNEQLVDYFKRRGLFVTGVKSGSAAETAGLRLGDIILSAASRESLTPAQLKMLLLNQRGPVTLKVLRNKKHVLYIRLSALSTKPEGGPRKAATPRRRQ
jgi:S1-C subfamily serine protease